MMLAKTDLAIAAPLRRDAGPGASCSPIFDKIAQEYELTKQPRCWRSPASRPCWRAQPVLAAHPGGPRHLPGAAAPPPGRAAAAVPRLRRRRPGGGHRAGRPTRPERRYGPGAGPADHGQRHRRRHAQHRLTTLGRGPFPPRSSAMRRGPFSARLRAGAVRRRTVRTGRRAAGKVAAAEVAAAEVATPEVTAAEVTGGAEVAAADVTAAGRRRPAAEVRRRRRSPPGSRRPYPGSAKAGREERVGDQHAADHADARPQRGLPPGRRVPPGRHRPPLVAPARVVVRGVRGRAAGRP